MRTHEGSSGKTRFHHNPDLSGDVRLVVPLEDNVTRGEVYVRGEDFLSFVAEYVRQRKMSESEDMGDGEVLGIRSGRRDGEA